MEKTTGEIEFRGRDLSEMTELAYYLREQGLDVEIEPKHEERGAIGLVIGLLHLTWGNVEKAAAVLELIDKARKGIALWRQKHPDRDDDDVKLTKPANDKPEADPDGDG